MLILLKYNINLLKPFKKIIMSFYHSIQFVVFASALCLTLAYPLDHQYYQSEDHGHGYESEIAAHDYGHGHQIERVSLGDEHSSYGHEEHHEDEHVDYYVSFWFLKKRNLFELIIN